MKMKTEKKSIVVTGASGFVGSLLVPRLLAAEHRLLLVGRSLDDLVKTYPDVPVCTYDELAENGQGFDMLVHLAGLHAGNALDEENTQRANIDLPVSVAHAAVAARIPVMLYRCSTHALDSEHDSLYTRSKREAIAQLQAVDGLEVRLAYMPLVYGDHWKGRFSILNSLPGLIAWPVFSAMAAFKPTCHIEHFASYIQEGAPQATTLLSDRQINNPVYSAVMRLIDLAFVIAVLMLLGWLLLLVWALIRLVRPVLGFLPNRGSAATARSSSAINLEPCSRAPPKSAPMKFRYRLLLRLANFCGKRKSMNYLKLLIFFVMRSV